MVQLITLETESELKNLYELFKNDDEETLRLGMSIFYALFPKSSFFLLGHVGSDENKPYFMSMFEIKNFNYIPKFTMQTIILNLLTYKAYYTYKPKLL